MILTADIGNSVITLGCFDRDRLDFTVRLSSEPKCTEDEYAIKILSVMKLHGADPFKIDGAIIASVVPPLNPVMRKAIKLVCGVDALTVGPGIKTGIGIRCDLPSSVGADIICACVAVAKLHGGPALVVDMDTATKISVIDGAGAFVGASIIPGVQMGLDSLSSGSAQLPRVELTPPDRVIGKNTADCMRSGVIFGASATVDGMIDRICRELGRELPVYVTGDQAESVIPFCQREMIPDEHLVLRGLNEIYKKNI